MEFANTDHKLAGAVDVEGSLRHLRLGLGNQHRNACHAADDFCLLWIAKGADWNG